ncbi:NTP pyrophosphohydrolase-like domain [Vibrio phage 1.236.O._10N.261.52.C4]|nr:NTP pyrophosphohydrolase-like domain [Vibrio phage 1.236.O._10N.261.52.C4]
MSLEITKQWFEQAIPEPTIEQACIQIGCHYEEVAEMAEAMADDELSVQIEHVSGSYKNLSPIFMDSVRNLSESEEVELLDSLVDQIVTAVGVGHMMGMDVLGALEEINRSNFSKFEDGKPVFDANGKITKGKDYVKPNLEKFV